MSKTVHTSEMLQLTVRLHALFENLKQIASRVKYVSQKVKLHHPKSLTKARFESNYSGSDFRLYDRYKLKTYLLKRWKGPDTLAVVRPTGVYLFDFFCSSIQFYLLLSPYLCFISFLYLDL